MIHKIISYLVLLIISKVKRYKAVKKLQKQSHCKDSDATKGNKISLKPNIIEPLSAYYAPWNFLKAQSRQHPGRWVEEAFDQPWKITAEWSWLALPAQIF